MIMIKKKLTNLKRYFRKWKELPLKVILYKIKRRLRLYFYYRSRRRNVGQTFLDVDKTRFMAFRTKSKCFFDPDFREAYADELRKLGQDGAILDDAGRILKHVFSLLGSGDMELPGKIQWNTDFKSGFTWENAFYKDIKIIDLTNSADIKIPWELSRFQHFFTLGKAYWLTDDEIYAGEFKAQMEDWIESNPIEASANWTCTMDVAIRAVNMITGWFFFCHSTSLDEGFWARFNQSLFLHGRFIMKNLENSEQFHNNHYLSDIAGLIWLGIYFKGFEAEDKYSANGPSEWLKFGLAEMKREIDIQINPDGTDYEAATAYHRLVSEILLYTALLCERNGICFDDDSMNRLKQMCFFLRDIIKPNGLSPLIGDMDDGRFIIASRYYSWERRDFRHIFALAGEVFGMEDFRKLSTGFEEDVLFCRNDPSCVDSSAEGIPYKNGGYYIIKNKSIYLFIRCGELSCRGAGSHSHNDQLSFELNYEGEDFIIDPGSYVYTSDYQMKKQFRSTRSHNTLCISDYEQNDFNDQEIFALKEQTFARCTRFKANSFEGLHYGYQGKCGAIHKRSFEISNNQICISDSVVWEKEIKNNLTTSIVFHLDPGVEAEVTGNTVKLIKNCIELVLQFEDSNITLEEGFVSYGYGRIVKSKIIVKENGLKQNIRTIVRCREDYV